MVARFPVAGCAVGGRALIDPVAVTGATTDPGMRSGEREGGQVVVQGGALPAAGRVALGAVLAELPIVPVVGPVTGDAALGCPRVLAARVTLHAGNLAVPAGERIGGGAMIEAGSLPAIRRVALGAVLAELPTVPIVRLVAGNTVLGRARVLVAGMAGRTGNLSMLPNECVRRAMIEGNCLPARGYVA